MSVKAHSLKLAQSALNYNIYLDMNELDYSKVMSYLKMRTKLKFSTIFNNGVYSPGVHIDSNMNLSDRLELIDIIKELIDKFKYQFTFSFLEDKIIKFNLNELIYNLSSNKGMTKVEVFLQPTTKVKITPLTEYIPKGPLFHFTSQDNLDSIINLGLIPKGRSQGLMGYNYPPEVHLLTSLNQMVRYENKMLVGASKWKTNLIGFKVNPSNYKFILDPSCDVGVICYDKISSNDLSLINNTEYEDLFNKYSIKDYRMFSKLIFKYIN